MRHRRHSRARGNPGESEIASGRSMAYALAGKLPVAHVFFELIQQNRKLLNESLLTGMELAVDGF